MQVLLHRLRRLHPLRLTFLVIGFMLFVVLVFNAGTQAEDPKYTEGQPRTESTINSRVFISAVESNSSISRLQIVQRETERTRGLQDIHSQKTIQKTDSINKAHRGSQRAAENQQSSNQQHNNPNSDEIKSKKQKHNKAE